MKSLLFSLFVFLSVIIFSGCYGSLESGNDAMQVYLDTENIDPIFRRAFTDRGIDYYIYGSEEEFKKWWEWVHPDRAFVEGAQGRYCEINGRREIWVIGKLTADYKVRPNPLLWAEEHFHAAEKMFPDLDDIHEWFYTTTSYPFD